MAGVLELSLLIVFKGNVAHDRLVLIEAPPQIYSNHSFLTRVRAWLFVFAGGQA